MTTVEEILAARPVGLKERALHAHKAKTEKQAMAVKREQEELEADSYDFMVEVLGVSPAELVDVDFVPDEYKTQSRHAMMTWKVEGLDFQSRYGFTKVIEKKSSQFDDEVIYAKELIVEVHPKTAWIPIKSLEELGDQLAKVND